MTVTDIATPTATGPASDRGPGRASDRASDRAPADELPRSADRTAVPRFLQVGASWGWRLLVVFATAAVLLWLVARLRVVVIPVLVSAMLAALLSPLVDLFDRFLPRLAAVWTSLLGVIGGLVALGWLVRSSFSDTATELRTQWDDAVVDVKAWLVGGPFGLERDRVDSVFSDVGTAARRYASGLFDEPGSVARMATDVVTGTLLVVVLTFFFLKDGRKMWGWLLDRLHPARRLTVDAAGRAAFSTVQAWIRGVAITGAVDGVLIGLALLVLGVPGAIPIALLTFVAAFFPIVGATLAGALAAAVALTTEGPQTAAIVALVVLVVQQVEGDVLLPMIMYRQVSLHPVVVLLALAVGAAVAGVVGAIVAVPVTACAVAAASAARRCGSVERLGVAEACNVVER